VLISVICKVLKTNSDNFPIHLRLVFVIEKRCVNWAVRNESLNIIQENCCIQRIVEVPEMKLTFDQFKLDL